MKSNIMIEKQASNSFQYSIFGYFPGNISVLDLFPKGGRKMFIFPAYTVYTLEGQKNTKNE
jgi:hypothetical protein